MMCPHENRIITASTFDVIKQPAIFGPQQDDFDRKETFAYKEIFVEDRIHGVVNVYPSASFNLSCDEVCGSVPPHQIEWKTDNCKDYLTWERQSYHEEDIGTPLFSNQSMCDDCLKQECSMSRARILCFECDRYLCEACECRHPDDFKIKTTNTQGEVDEVVDKVLESILHDADREQEFMKIMVDIAEKIHVKHELDVSDCYITGLCALEDGRMVGIDYFNSAVKIFRGSKIQQYVKLSTNPFDVTETMDQTPGHANKQSSDEQPVDVQFISEKCKIAITCPSARTVLILEMVQGQPIRKTCIPVGAKCLGIDKTNNFLIVVCEDPDRLNVLLMKENGVMLRVVGQNISSASLFAYVHVNSGTGVTCLLKHLTGSHGTFMTSHTEEIDFVLTFNPILSTHSYKAFLEQNDSDEVVTCPCVNSRNGSLTPVTNKECKWESVLTYLGAEIGQQALCVCGDTICLSEIFSCQNRNFITVLRTI